MYVMGFVSKEESVDVNSNKGRLLPRNAIEEEFQVHLVGFTFAQPCSLSKGLELFDKDCK